MLTKHASKACLQNPDAITTRRLRKHMATISQIFSMNDQEIEQLATFMGHSSLTHRNEYRLPDDIFQTAKISKVLLMMEDGSAGKYKGKSLDEIDINLEENLLAPGDNINDDDSCDEKKDWERRDYENKEDLSTEMFGKTSDPAQNLTALTENKATKKKQRILIPWTTEQKTIVKEFFKEHIMKQKPPKRGECEEIISKYPILLANKNWLKIKVFIQNLYTKKQKN